MPTGGNVIDDFGSQAKEISGVTPNRTVIVAPTSADKAKDAKDSGTGQFIDASSMEKVVEQSEPRITADVKQPGQKSAVECEMVYGDDRPAQVVADFDDAHLVVKVRMKTPVSETNEIKNRPLLDQRLQSIVAEQVLQEAMQDDDFLAAIEEAASRKAIVSELESLLQKIQDKRTAAIASDQVAS